MCYINVSGNYIEMRNGILILLTALIACQPQSETRQVSSIIEFDNLKQSLDSLFNAEIGTNEPGAH